MPNGQNSFEFYGGRVTPSHLSVQRFETGVIALGVGGPIDMVNTSISKLTAPGRNQSIQLKDVVLGLSLPNLAQEGDVLSQIGGLYVAATFLVTVNVSQFQFPVVFTTNTDRIRSQLWLASLPEVVRSLTVSVVVDSVNAEVENKDCQLYTTLEFYCITDK